MTGSRVHTISEEAVSNREVGDAGAADVRTRARALARRGLMRVGPARRLLTREAEQRAALDRMVPFYEALRRYFAPKRVPPQDVPSVSDLEAVQIEAHKAKIYAEFFDTLGVEGDFAPAAGAMTRKLLEQYRRKGGTSRARIYFQVFQQYEQLRPIADICLALCAFGEPMPEPAWALFTRNDLALVVRWAASEYFQLGFRRDPATAAASLSRVLSGEVELRADPDVWMEIAYHAFAAGERALAAQTLERAEAAVPTVTNRERLQPLQRRLSTLQEWLDRAARAEQPVAAPSGEIPVALVGFKHPDRRAMSRDLDDPIETLAALGHLLRHDGVKFSGDPGLVAAAEQLRSDVAPDRRIGGADATVRLYEVERDASRYASVPDGTWIIVSEWFTSPLAGAHFDMPLNDKLRPIFISFHITPKELGAPGVIDYLRKYGPIGCREWDTVFLLHAAGVPAYFSGALTMTVDTIVAPTPSRPQAHTLFVDVAPEGPGEPRSRLAPRMRDRELGENLTAAAAELRGYRDGAARIVTSDVRFYLPVRAVGCPAELRVTDAADYRTIDFADLSDAAFAGIQQGISEKLSAVLGAVLAGRSERDVYKTWRKLCAAEVAQAETELHSITGNPKLDFDLDEACKVIRAGSVTIERSEPGPDGPEVNVEFSVDGNYKHQLDIVLDSVVERCSRPIRAFVLCRGLVQEDFDRMARLFPTVSFVWLPTDNVQYGHIPGKIKWATIVTMDRTIMSVLLDDVDRIIHFDLDAMCLADLAELFDVDMEGKAIAAADEPQLNHSGGFNGFRGSAARLRREGKPELAREVLLRTHAEHAFDFTVFNAGIMVLDLAKMRAEDFCGRYLAYVQRFGINGQAVLNFYVAGNRKKLDPTWNRLVRLEVSDTPKIPHWAGPFKPWQGHRYVSGRELWQAQEERFAARTANLKKSAAPTG
jgi:lipopolysaccharide biosynthesis glycosyltransferase